MNPAQLLENFDRISEAPDAVAQLRRFILDLAVRGELVEQDPDDEPAAELLKQIQAEKARLVKEGSLKKAKLTLPIRDDEQPFSTPVQWQFVRLGDVLEMINGRAFKPTDWLDRGLPIVRIQNLNNVQALFNYCDPGTVDDRHLIRDNEFLISWSGTPGTSFGAFIWKRGFAALNQHIFRCIQIGDAFWPDFLRLAINSQLDVLISKAQGGVGLQHVTKGTLEALPLPLPPLAEQHRIVAKVDELMALCDQLEVAKNEREARCDRLVAASLHRISTAAADEAATEAQSAIPLRDAARFHLDHLPRLTTHAEHIKQLRQTILNLAVRGRLVPQDPNDEPASATVDLVSKEAMKAVQAGVIRRYGLDEPVDDSGLSELPPGWRWSRLVEITRPVPYAIKRGPFGSAIRKDMFVPKGFKVYEQQHAISGDFTKGRYYITEAKFEELRAFELHPNEILVSCSGTVGKVAVVPASIERGVINQALLKLSLHESTLRNEYFLILFPAFFMVTETLTDLQGTAQKNIPGMEILKKMPFPLPPLAEQHRIVAKVDELMALCDQLEAQLTTTQTDSRRLLEAVLHEALAAAV